MEAGENKDLWNRSCVGSAANWDQPLVLQNQMIDCWQGLEMHSLSLGALIFSKSTETAEISWKGDKDFLNQMQIDV